MQCTGFTDTSVHTATMWPIDVKRTNENWALASLQPTKVRFGSIGWLFDGTWIADMYDFYYVCACGLILRYGMPLLIINILLLWYVHLHLVKTIRGPIDGLSAGTNSSAWSKATEGRC